MFIDKGHTSVITLKRSNLLILRLKMSKAILILGESGSGKSTSLRNLDPSETIIIDVVGKGLPFQNWRKAYNKKNKNYLVEINASKIFNYLKTFSKNFPKIKNIVIDDFQYIMSDEFMNRAKEKSFEKFTEIGLNAYKILRVSRQLRNDLNVIILGHEAESENRTRRMKTIGKLLDDKITPEGLFNYVLFSEFTEDGYKFRTHGNGLTTAKTPLGMFEDDYIENDLKLVLEKISNYEG